MSSFIEAVIAGLIAGALTGLVTGLLSNYIISRHFRAIDQHNIVVGMARDLAQECYNLLDLTNKFIKQIELRKYRAYEILQVIKNLNGEEKRRIRNKMVMEIDVAEVQKTILEQLCVSIHMKQIENMLRSNRGILMEIVERMNAAKDAAGVLCLEFSKIENFYIYIDNIEHLPELPFEEFIEKLEDEEAKICQTIQSYRDELKKTHLDLVIALRDMAVEHKKSFFNNSDEISAEHDSQKIDSNGVNQL